MLTHLMRALFALVACPGCWFHPPSAGLSAVHARAAVCSVPTAFVLLVGAFVTDAVMLVGACAFACGLVARAALVLALLPASPVAALCPVPFRPTGADDAEAPLGQCVVSDEFSFSNSFLHDFFTLL
jgi:hypothetical protein